MAQMEHELDRLPTSLEDASSDAVEAVRNDIQELIGRVGSAITDAGSPVVAAGVDVLVGEAATTTGPSSAQIPVDLVGEVEYKSHVLDGSAPHEEPHNTLDSVSNVAREGEGSVEELLFEISASLNEMATSVSQATTPGTHGVGSDGGLPMLSERSRPGLSQRAVRQRRLKIKPASPYSDDDSSRRSAVTGATGVTQGRSAKETSELGEDRSSLVHLVAHRGEGSPIKVVVQSVSGQTCFSPPLLHLHVLLPFPPLSLTDSPSRSVCLCRSFWAPCSVVVKRAHA